METHNRAVSVATRIALVCKHHMLDRVDCMRNNSCQAMEERLESPPASRIHVTNSMRYSTWADQTLVEALGIDPLCKRVAVALRKPRTRSWKEDLQGEAFDFSVFCEDRA